MTASKTKFYYLFFLHQQIMFGSYLIVSAFRGSGVKEIAGMQSFYFTYDIFGTSHTHFDETELNCEIICRLCQILTLVKTKKKLKE